MNRGILATSRELASLKDRISHHPFGRFYDALSSRCALVLDSAPITEMGWQAAWASGRKNAATIAARGLQGRIFDLVIANAIDRNAAYISRAVEELRNLIGWSRWVDPSETDLTVDLCTAETALAAVIGLDWLWDELDDAFRAKAVSRLRERVIQPYVASVRDGSAWWYETVNHWNAVINAACGIVGIALNDDDDNAGRALDLATKGLRKFFNDLGDGGGWNEGIGYWGYAMRYIALFGETCARIVDDRSIWHYRGMKHTGSFPLYFSPNGYPASFGYAAKMPLHGSLYLLDKYLDCGEITWWLDTFAFGHDVDTTDWSQGVFILFRPDRDSPPKEPLMEPVKVYADVGWAAMADRWPKPGFYVAAKTGDLSVNYSQRDMNSIQLQVGGEMLLVDMGHFHHRDNSYFSRPGEEMFEMHSKLHNTAILGEEDHRPDALGGIREARYGARYRWILCDGGEACGAGSSFYRHLVMMCDENGAGRHLLVLDEIDPGLSDTLHVFWHLGGVPEFTKGGLSGEIRGKRIPLYCSFGGSGDISARVLKNGTNNNHEDRYIELTADSAEPLYTASVFSLDPLDGGVNIETSEKHLHISFRNHSLRFGPGASRYRVLQALDNLPVVTD